MPTAECRAVGGTGGHGTPSSGHRVALEVAWDGHGRHGDPRWPTRRASRDFKVHNFKDNEADSHMTLRRRTVESDKHAAV